LSFLVPPDGRSSSIRRKCLGASLVLILAFGSVVLGPDATRAATGDVTRLAGADRYATAAAISRATYAAGVAVAYIATGTTFPDALAGAAAAGKHKAPLLLTRPAGLPSSTATELARLRPGRIVVLGSAGAVSETVVSALRGHTAGDVTRLAGADRYATAAAISRATYAAGVGVAYIATGTTFPDALAGAAAAGKQGAPLLLTTPGGLPSSTATELARLRPGRIVVLGSAGAVSETVVSALRSHTVSDAWPTTGRRPYTASSVWNTALAANAAVDSRSAQMIATIAASSTGRLRSDPDQYTYPVVFADAATPRVTLTCTSLCSTVTADGKRQPSTKSMTIPLPSSARPSAGSDAQLIVIDRVSGDEYNLFEFSSAARSATNASRYVNGVHRDGMPSSYISRGAGIPYLAGLIRPWEIAAGRIDHAIPFAYALTRADRCVFPATKTDGKQTRLDAIPEGARLRLDPRLDVNAITGLDRTGRIIARALQQYGAIAVDSSGSNKLYAESSVTAAWDGILDASTVGAIPVSRLQIMTLPAGYWSSTYAAIWGSCAR